MLVLRLVGPFVLLLFVRLQRGMFKLALLGRRLFLLRVVQRTRRVSHLRLLVLLRLLQRRVAKLLALQWLLQLVVL